MSNRVMVVDDDEAIRKALKQVLTYEKYQLRLTSSGGEALTVYPEFRPQVVLLDVKMAGMDGLETLDRLRELDPEVVVIMISGHATIATAIEATRRGAFDFLEKPLDTDRLLVTLRNALNLEELAGDYRRLRREAVARHEMVGESAALTAVRDTIARVGPSPARVLITGENGTGKELVARAIHDSSPRRKRPFVEVNCAAIPSELIESELFGHMKGSFTGAVADRAGKFEQADGGSLFLDEIGDMSPTAQAKVLRALQEGVVTRVGGDKPITVDVRVIAATNKNLEEEIRAGRFREDLYYRLNVVPVRIPPLRERQDDVPLLIKHFAAQMAKAGGAARKIMDPAAIVALRQRPWPGNVRELRNAVERLLLLSTGKTITAADVRRLLGEPGGDSLALPALTTQNLHAYLEEAETVFLRVNLERNNWNIAETARAIKMPRSNLYKRLLRYDLVREGAANG